LPETVPLNDLTPLISPAMPYDQKEPQNGQSLDADALRVQLQGLFEAITSIVPVSLSFALPFEKHCLTRVQRVKRADLTFAYSTTNFSLT
jgi:hypothetical protein